MDAVLVSRSDTRQAVAEALTRLRDDLERLARRRFPTLDAGEIVQRASLRALERHASVRDLERIDAWMRRIVITSAIDLIRERRGEVPFAEPPEVPAPVADGPVCGCTLKLIPSLPASYAEILRRVDVEGAALGDVAASLGIASGTAAVRLHRARRALGTRVRKRCGVESMQPCLACSCTDHSCCGSA